MNQKKTETTALIVFALVALLTFPCILFGSLLGGCLRRGEQRAPIEVQDASGPPH